jgi:nucleotide-binding universal stress UspA family protein
MRAEQPQVSFVIAITTDAKRHTTRIATEIVQLRGTRLVWRRCSPGSEEGFVFKRIVVGTDGSETASVAVQHATELAKATGASLDLVSAFEPVPQDRLRNEAQQVPGDIAHGVGPREDVNALLENAAGAARDAGVEAATHAREGDPADAILDVAEEIGADLIVVGNKGMTGARRFLLGSVPNKISHHAPCGVYIVRTT